MEATCRKHQAHNFVVLEKMRRKKKKRIIVVCVTVTMMSQHHTMLDLLLPLSPTLSIQDTLFNSMVVLYRSY